MKNKHVSLIFRRLWIPLSIFLLFCAAIHVQAQCNRASDSLELIKLYDATMGANWINKTNWKTVQPMSTWFGVTVDAGGCILRLDLRNNQLTGTIPNLNLPILQSLALPNNQIGGTLLNWNMPSLQTLELSNNQIGGTIPVFNMPNLVHFNLYNNKFTGTIPVLNMPVLQRFDVSFNQLTGTLPNFNLPQLKWFQLNDNRLSGTFSTVNLSNLEIFWAYNNQLSGIIPQVKTIADFKCENNRFTFESILTNNSNVVNKTYVPQDSIYKDTTINFTVGSNLTIDLAIDAAITDNKYQWFKNGTALGTPIIGSNKLPLSNLQATDVGVYTCQVTNPRAPLLTLNSRKITIQTTPCTVTAGTPITAQQICFGQTVAIDLATLLQNETAGGTWTALQTTGANFNATAGTLSTNGLVAGDYKFQYKIIGTCRTDSQIVTVPIFPLPIFNRIDTIKQCGSSPQIFNLSAHDSRILGGQTASVFWFSTNATTNRITTPSNYSSSSGTVYAQTVSGAGCRSALTPVTLAVTNSLSAGSAIATPSLALCSQATSLPVVNLPNLLRGSNTGGVWTALQATGSNFNATAATFNPNNIAGGIYAFKYKIANGCGTDSAIVQIIMGATPKVEAGQSFDTLTCVKTEIILRGGILANNSPNVTVQWTTPSGNFNTASITTNEAGWHYFTATENINQCFSTDSVLISIDTVHPVITLIETDSTRCGNSADGKITISTINTGFPFKYRLNNGSPSNQNIFDLLAEGTYTIVVEGRNGCRATSTALVGTPPIMTTKIELTNTLSTVYKGSVVPLKATVEDARSAVRYTWTSSDPSGNLNCTLCPTPQYRASGNALLRVVATDTYNCKATDTLSITVREKFVPDVISPNNDGSNDILIFPDLESCGSEPDCDKKYPNNELIIVNRWGSEVFRAKPYRNDWAGINSKGQLLSQGTYYYVLRLDLAQGNIIKGNVLLMSQ